MRKALMVCLYDFAAQRLDGSTEDLSRYRGELVLVVNTASKCGLTPQLSGLEDLQNRYGHRGFHVLGFPCNQFARQDPGDAAAIASFCERNYGVTFPMFAKVEVNGARTHPLFAWLKASCPGLLGSRQVKWNFTKFLVDRAGHAVQRFAPMTGPAALAPLIEVRL